MKLDTYFMVIEFHSLVRVYILTDWAMKGESQNVHSFGQSIWVKSRVQGRRTFCTGPLGKKIWVEHHPKRGKKLEDLHEESGWKWK